MDPNRIDVDILSESLVRMTEDPEIRANAQAMSVKIRKEDGVANAVRVIERATGASRNLDVLQIAEQ
jgi:UDP:flavonoid glycosyltransferase YjiC (YdhE family)